MGAMNRFFSIVDYVWLPLLLIASWEFYASLGDAPIYLPRFSVVLHALFELCKTSGFWWQVASTCARCAIGFLVALTIAVPVGISLGASPQLYRKMRLLIEFFRPLPSASIIPICILFLGIGEEMKIFVISFGSAWPILINAIDGVLNIHHDYNKVASAYKIQGIKKILKITLPLSLPSIFSGMKVAISIALILTITAEMIVGGGGLGYFIIDAERAFRFENMYAAVLFVGFLGIIVNIGFSKVEHKLIAWK